MSYNIRSVDHIVQQNRVIWIYAGGDYGPKDKKHISFTEHLVF